MTKKINENKKYRPCVIDPNQEIRRQVDEMCEKYPNFSKSGMESMIFKSGLPVVKRNLQAVEKTI